MSVKINNSAGGSVTLDSTTTSNEALTLPTGGGTLVNADSSGNVGIGTTAPSAKLHIKGDNLGGTIGDDTNLLTLRHSNGNSSYLEFTGVRTATGTNWLSTSTRIQQRIDSVKQGYIQFNGDDNNYGISFGKSDTDYMRIDSAGRVTMPYQPVASFSLGSGANSFTANQGVFATTNVLNRALQGITHTSSNGRFTVPVAGAYYMHFFTMKEGAVSAYYDIQKNDSDIGARAYDNSTGTGWKPFGLGGVFNLAANDYITVVCKFGQTNNAHGLNHMNFTLYLIG